MKIPQRLGFRWLGSGDILGRRGKTTVVICPTLELPAELKIDLDHCIEACSRWPEVQDCGQSCTPQVRFSEDDLNEFAIRYSGAQCASCGVVLTRDDWYNSRLAAIGIKRVIPKTVRPLYSSISGNNDPICSMCYGHR